VILLTSGLGMIGAHTAGALLDLGHEVLVTAHRRSDVPSFLAGRVTVEPLDVTDRDAFLALGTQHAISDIVHLAGSVQLPLKAGSSLRAWCSRRAPGGCPSWLRRSWS
jgi:nucleoside-diphosphate-sugar epimerase